MIVFNYLFSSVTQPTMPQNGTLNSIGCHIMTIPHWHKHFLIFSSYIYSKWSNMISYINLGSIPPLEVSIIFMNEHDVSSWFRPRFLINYWNIGPCEYCYIKLPRISWCVGFYLRVDHSMFTTFQLNLLTFGHIVSYYS